MVGVACCAAILTDPLEIACVAGVVVDRSSVARRECRGNTVLRKVILVYDPTNQNDNTLGNNIAVEQRTTVVLCEMSIRFRKLTCRKRHKTEID